MGTPGTTGPSGSSGGSAGACACSAGPMGPEGQQGLPGAHGATGPTGPQGAPGTPGASGKDGAPGMMGSAGPVGQTGAAGPSGNIPKASIYEVTKSVQSTSGLTVEAACNSAKDILLTGGCYALMSPLHGSAPSIDPTNAAASSWKCAFGWGGVAENWLAYAYCLPVP